ncbi:MAG: acyltransferase [Clostridia bacterium]|nr:acyltransferase [Clostridia bacterium]
MAENKKTRNSNLEILRIISMLLIVAHHFAVHGFKIEETPISVNHYLLHIFESGGKLGVSCFILISGYFMCRSKFTLNKLIKIISEVLFYSLVIVLIFYKTFSSANFVGKLFLFIRTMFPIGNGAYWFMTDFIVLMLISPLLNKALHTDRITVKRTILTFFIIWSVMPSLIGVSYGFNELGWFVVLYFIAGYIREYGSFSNEKPLKNFMLSSLILIMAIFAKIVCCRLNNMGIGFFENYGYIFLNLNSPFILISAIELFVGFLKLKPYSSKIINIISSATFGVYLIHDNNIVRPYLWERLLRVENLFNSKLFVIYAVIDILAVYIVCTLIDLIRQATVEKIYLKVVYKNTESIKNNALRILQKPVEKIKNLIGYMF